MRCVANVSCEATAIDPDWDVLVASAPPRGSGLESADCARSNDA